MKEYFFEALEQNSIEQMRKIPKSDHHNHAARGGTKDYVAKCLDIKFPDRNEVFSSIDEMDNWIKGILDTSSVSGKMRYLRCVEAAFIAAKEDHVTYLSLNFGIGEVFAYGGIENFAKIINYGING
jgi:adenosine deaminase